MSVVRGTGLSNYPNLVSELGGDPAALLRAAGVREQDVGNYDAFIPVRAVIRAIETAAAATGTHDFGRQLAQRQGIEILGPVGVAARTAATVADALMIFHTFMAAYSPAIHIEITPLARTQRSVVAIEIVPDDPIPCPHTLELALGVSLGVFRLLMGADYTPLAVHLPHDPLTPPTTYVRYFECTPHFAERRSGFTVRSTDLVRPLHRDELAHRAVVDYLSSITPLGAGIVESVRTMARHLLPTGATTLEVVAAQFHLHPKTLQRRLADESTTFAALIDEVRKETADRYLRTTAMSLSHLARELGYAEQSVLTRSCKRWFGIGPAAYRAKTRVRATPRRR
ncbi:AraC family transcriptional regulator [Mycobacterium ulcerans]|uniref:AraC family transcriptional regulator n=1 Tax=Mycobacterium ulcerans TaxID=1809 RepID=UPI0008F8BB52|nr:AraC family transcriptional regulator [Mycobacterium ulcerans]MEB3903367.1 AraC family transcriptional regulator [Mycobacterium ulcerans]MEB3907545.1 AraC family transcriptional regulator [Mycobacterium ulcerans]MEB3917602.1 AraC family transcriptional regulator [Mycobacterium ulcerans]MEB3921645.1 AraC family transcriptional regulator [Mycobacterium ulcerans]MEB3925865.1 AraC family transcriptional regulator [Mycobacterium ulcerans]